MVNFVPMSPTSFPHLLNTCICRFSFVLPALASPGTLGRYIHLSIAVFLIFNVFFNYFKTVFTPPGYTPESYGEQDVESGLNEEHKHWDGFGRFCKKCRKAKPARTHHCSICRRCGDKPSPPCSPYEIIGLAALTWSSVSICCLWHP